MTISYEESIKDRPEPLDRIETLLLRLDWCGVRRGWWR
jgi:hypothetical protein